MHFERFTTWGRCEPLPRRYYVTRLDSTPHLDPAGEFLPYLLSQEDEPSVFDLPPATKRRIRHPLTRALDNWIRYIRQGELGAAGHLHQHEFQVSTMKGVLVELELRSIADPHFHSLADSGFGYSQLLPILVRGLLAAPGSTLVVEQPEVHLNPALQVRLAEFFVAMVKAGKQVIVETHSEHIVNAIRVLTAEDESNDLAGRSKIYFLEATANGPAVSGLFYSKGWLSCGLAHELLRRGIVTFGAPIACTEEIQSKANRQARGASIMPPLLCGSPCIMDQSFPRDTQELSLVADALGGIEECVSENRAHLLLTDTLAELVEAFDWNRTKDFPILIDIYRLLTNWFLQPHERLVRVSVDDIATYSPHPVPEGVEGKGLVELWSDEVGKLLELHDKCTDDNSYFVGIACERAFGGAEVSKYPPPASSRAFPLVGPSSIDILADGYLWEGIPSNVRDRRVSIAHARKNLGLLGARAIENPRSGTSHSRVTFDGARSWTLDTNNDPIPETFLKELVPITGFPLAVIKTALTEGSMPTRTGLRFLRTCRGRP